MLVKQTFEYKKNTLQTEILAVDPETQHEGQSKWQQAAYLYTLFSSIYSSWGLASHLPQADILKPESATDSTSNLQGTS